MTEDETRELFEKTLAEIRDTLERNGVQFEWVDYHHEGGHLNIQRVDNWRHAARVDPEDMETY